MKKIVSFHFLMRLAALVTVFLSAAVFCFRFGWMAFTPEAVCCWLIAGNVVLAMYPLSYEDLRVSMWAVSLTVMTFLSMSVFCGCGGAVWMYVLLSVFLLLGFLVLTNVRKYSRVRSLFHNEAVWYAAMDDARNFYLCLLFSTLALCLLAGRIGRDDFVFILVIGMNGALFSLQWARAYTGRTVFLSREKERNLKEIAGNIVNTLPPESPGEQMKMNRIYDEVLRYMRDEKPYLDDDFSIEKFARILGVNRTVLSHVINVYSGRNFRQFVNYYRVQYSVELMKREPYLRVMEVALMCGFHTVVSFNMAFKIVMEMTPSEFQARVRGT